MGWIHWLLWVSLSLESALIKAETDVSRAGVRLSVQTHHSESRFLTRTIKNPLGLFDEETEQKMIVKG